MRNTVIMIVSILLLVLCLIRPIPDTAIYVSGNLVISSSEGLIRLSSHEPEDFAHLNQGDRIFYVCHHASAYATVYPPHVRAFFWFRYADGGIPSAWVEYLSGMGWLEAE